ncbi:hypothetical protein [Streptosporangium sp. CA-115845]
MGPGLALPNEQGVLRRHAQLGDPAQGMSLGGPLERRHGGCRDDDR